MDLSKFPAFYDLKMISYMLYDVFVDGKSIGQLKMHHGVVLFTAISGSKKMDFPEVKDAVRWLWTMNLN